MGSTKGMPDDCGYALITLTYCITKEYSVLLFNDTGYERREVWRFYRACKVVLTALVLFGAAGCGAYRSNILQKAVVFSSAR